MSFAALGHSNKLIAYELGVRNSTVSLRLHTAMQKHGMCDRPEFTRSMGDLGALADAFADREEPA